MHDVHVIRVLVQAGPQTVHGKLGQAGPMPDLGPLQAV